MNTGTRDESTAEVGGTMIVWCDAFEDAAPIPQRFTCDGDDLSPPLQWSGNPPDTVEFALIVEDPDAPGGTFVHWVVWGVPSTESGMAEGAVPSGARQGRNDFGRSGWGGPCPPRGHGPHRYAFEVYALSAPVELGEGAAADELRAAMEPNVLAWGTLTGTYERSR